MYIVFVTAFFTNDEHSPLTGMPQYIYKATKYLSQRNHRVEIVAGARSEKKWKYKGITVHNCATPQKLEGNDFHISKQIVEREVILQKKLQELNKKRSISIVQYAGWSGIGCFHSLKCPGILRMTTYSCITYKYDEAVKDYVNCYSFWERMAGRRAYGVISPCRIIGDEFGKDIRRKVQVMETPYDVEVIENCELYNEKLKGKEYILFYGSASSGKGFDVIRKMMPRFLRENKNAYFVVAGWATKSVNGSSIGKLVKELGTNVNRFIYLGTIEHAKLFPIIRQAKCVLMPSLKDNFPNACLESLSLGQIVIGTYGTGMEQLIRNGKNSFLIQPNDVGALYEAATKAFSLDSIERNRMCNASEKILKKYSPEVAIRKLEKYYMKRIALKEQGKIRKNREKRR